MRTGLRITFAVGLTLLFSLGSTMFVHAGRITALYIGPITVNNGNGPHTVGTPDSIAYTYTGTRAVCSLATSYMLDTVAHTSTVIGYDIYTYTSTDSLLTDIAQTVSNGAATNSTRLSRAYDMAGNDTVILNEYWNAATSAWIPTFQTIFTYNVARQRTGLLRQSWNTTTSSWSNVSRIAYQYDNAGRDSSNLQQKWVAAINSWKNVALNQTVYTSFNKIATTKSQRWSDTTSVWKDSTGTVNHYNSSNYLVSSVNGPTYFSGSVSTMDSIVTTSYNSAGSPLVQIFYGKNILLGYPYLAYYRYTYSYNAANQLLSNQTEMIDNTFTAYNSLTGYYAYNGAGQNTLSEPVSLQATNGILDMEQYRSYYEAPAGVTHSAGPAASRITIYPLPATSDITLSLSSEWKGTITGTISDVTGKIWYQWSAPVTANYSRQISVLTLPAGVYNLRLIGNGFTDSKMLIIQH